MVATRRGVRVYTPAKTTPEQTSDVQATPSTSRRTRSTAKQAESPTQHALVETSSQLEKSEGRPEASTPCSLLKRCARASRLHSPEQPCTPVGSIHEADMSDCSAVSDIELPMTRTRGGRRQPRTTSQEEEEISEVESCSSAVSSSKASQSRRRSTRRKTVPKSPDPARVEGRGVVLVSESQRVTRSQRKTTSTRSSAKQQTEDSELSDADSWVSSLSGAEFPKSTTRRPRRSTRQTGSIPIQLDEASETSQSPTTRAGMRRSARGKADATVDVSESRSCDSDGFESGPTYSVVTRRRGKSQSTGPKNMDSDSDLTDVQSQMSRGTPCSSRTGSGSSIRSARATRSVVKDCSIVLEKTREPVEEDTSLNNSTLESTVIFQDKDCTLLEEDENQTFEEKEEDGVTSTDLTSAQAETRSVEKGVIVIEDDPHQEPLLIPDSPGCAEEAVSKPAVTVVHQQEEPCAENKEEDIAEKETMQETIPPSEPLGPCESDTVTLRESASEVTEQPEEKDEAMEVAEADAHSPLGDEDAVVESVPDDDDDEEEEKMEVSTLNSDAQQVVDSNTVQVESIQVTSSQQHNITADSDPEQQPKDVVIQNTKTISLLDSTDDEDSEEEESKVSGEEEEEEDLGYRAEEGEGPSQKCEAAAASVDGLFMVDTRPGQDTNDQYYKERPTEEETKEGVEQEDQDEFVDEEGDDDDEDEDAELLFSGRNPQLKELSSRIDPGIRVKELGGLYINFDGSKSKPVSTSLRKLKEKKIQDEVMKKCVMGPDFEKKDSVPPYSESKQAAKLKRRTEREKSTGDGWFNMKAPEITQELKGDLQVLRMRGSMDPKRFYKKNDRDGFPKYFQVGTVVDNAVDFYHSRVPKKQRKRTMVEELLSDAEFRQNNKKKYQHIMTEKAAQGAGKRNKKKRFHKK